MQINGVTDIHDNGKTVLIKTESGSVIHLPAGIRHSMTILDIECPSDNMFVCVNINLYQD